MGEYERLMSLQERIQKMYHAQTRVLADPEVSEWQRDTARIRATCYQVVMDLIEREIAGADDE